MTDGNTPAGMGDTGRAALTGRDVVTNVSAFFPCYNDAESIGTMVAAVDTALETSVDD
jgi:hypothetical protein